MTARVLVVDDIIANVRLLEAKLSAEYFEVITAMNGLDALDAVQKSRPDIILLDIMMPGIDGIEVCRQIRSSHPEIKAIILTSFDDDEALFAAIMAGAAGYVLKQVTGQDLVAAIHHVASGGSLLDPSVTAKVMERLREGAPGEPDELKSLTAQERRILELVAEGLTNRQIGERLFLAEKTVKNYMSNVLSKLGLERRTQAAVFASRLLDDK